MRIYGVIVLLTVLSVSPYAYSQPPSCPCDDIELSSGNTGSDIFEILCPDGELSEGAESVVLRESVDVFISDSGLIIYQTNDLGDGFSCSISDASQGNGTEITEEDYQNCRRKLIEGCNLKQINPIPTLSDWGLVAMAAILGVAGYFVVRRRKAAA